MRVHVLLQLTGNTTWRRLFSCLPYLLLLLPATCLRAACLLLLPPRVYAMSVRCACCVCCRPTVLLRYPVPMCLSSLCCACYSSRASYHVVAVNKI